LDKKSEKGRQEWEKTCVESGLSPHKLKTLIKTRFVRKTIMFEGCFEFKKTIFLCYDRQKIVTLQQGVLKAQVWAIAKAIISCLNFIVSACVMNQSKRHWLLSDALTIVVNISFNIKAKVVGFNEGSKILNEFDSKLLTLQKDM